MNRPNQPFVFFVNMLAGWLNRRQLKVIDYLVEENRILRAMADPSSTMTFPQLPLRRFWTPCLEASLYCGHSRASFRRLRKEARVEFLEANAPPSPGQPA